MKFFSLILISLLFTFQTHPFWLSIILLILTLIMMMSFMQDNISYHWFNYIFIMIYSGGLLLLFIYVASLSPNTTTPLNTWPILGATIMMNLLNTTYYHYSTSLTKQSELEFSLTTNNFTTTPLFLAYILMMLVFISTLLNLLKSPLRLL